MTNFDHKYFIKQKWEARCRYRQARTQGLFSSSQFHLGQFLAYTSVLRLVYSRPFFGCD